MVMIFKHLFSSIKFNSLNKSVAKIFSFKKYPMAILMVIFLGSPKYIFGFYDRPYRSQKQLNVIWILIDALRADHLGCYGYQKNTSPFLDKFATDSILFKNAFSQESYTLASVPSFFTSTYPSNHGVLYSRPRFDILNARFVTIAEILKDNRYETAAFVFNPSLKAKFNFGQGFDIYDDNKKGIDHSLPPYEAFETANKIYVKVEKYLKKQKRRPIFLYLHYRDVHEPYVPPDPYHKLFLPEKIEPLIDILPAKKIGFKNAKKEDIDLIVSQYDGEIKYTDFYIEKTLDLLRKNNINTDNSIFIISSDHGEEFLDSHPGDNGGFSHGRTLYQEQIHVPLIMSIPGIKEKKQVISPLVQLIDIVPTILDIIDIDKSRFKQFQGKSLLPILNDKEFVNRFVFSGGNHGRGVLMDEKWKYYRYDNFYKVGKRMELSPSIFLIPLIVEEIYNIKSDPGETKNLIHQQNEIVSNFRKEYDLFYQLNLKDKASRKSIKLDSRTRKQLKSLGYLE